MKIIKVPKKLDAIEIRRKVGRPKDLSSDILRGPSVLAMTLDLAGCAYGPEDLSTNPAYLEAYGE